MQTPKKRKRDTVEVEPPLVTYDAPTRTFDRLFKEDNLEGMRNVVRQKLGVATSVPIYLSQVREGKSVDLEDADDFEAFRVFARGSQAVKVKVVVGSDAPANQPLPNGDSKFLSSSGKKEKKRSNAVEPSSAASSPMVELPPPQKRRRVSFVELPGENAANVPVTPGKKKRKHVDSSAPPKVGHEPPSDTVVLKSSTKESTEKKEKKTPVIVSEELSFTHTGNDPETISRTPSTKKTKKRPRESTSEVMVEVISSSQPQKTDSLSDKEDDTSRSTKNSKKKRKEAVDKPAAPQNSRSKSVPPPSMKQTSTVDIPPPAVGPSVGPEASVKPKKTSKKGKDQAGSEPPVAAPSSPELVRHDEASNEKKKKAKSKAKVGDSSVDSSTINVSEVKRTNDILTQQKEMLPSESATPDQTARKKTKAVESPRETESTLSTIPRNDTGVEEPSSEPAESKTPRERRKSQTAETDKPSRSGSGPENSRDADNSKDPINKQLRAATLEAVQAVLARKGLTAAQAPVSQAAVQAASSSALSIEEGDPTEPCSTCPLCDESPSHDRSLCPVIKGGVRAMRKRLSQLQKDTSGDETRREGRPRIIAELQDMIQKRTRKPKTSNSAKGSTVAKKDVVKDGDVSATPAPIAAATKTVKQVDVVSPLTPVVDVIPPAASQLVKSTPSIAKSSKLAQPSSSQPPPSSQQPSLSQKSATKIAQVKSTTEILMANLPLVTDPNVSNLGDLSSQYLSQLTDNDLQSIIFGPKATIADVRSSDEDEEEQDQEESLLDEDEPQPKMHGSLSHGSTRLEYPSSSDAGEEDDNSAEGSVTKANVPSLSTEGDDQIDNTEISDDLLPFGEGDSLFGEVDTRGSSREIDKTGDDAVEAALAKDLAPLNGVLPINGKPKTTEADSDTVVGSQGEEFHAKENRVKSTTAVANDPIEPSEQPPNEQPDLIVFDNDHPPVQSTPKVESTIRTRSQRKKDAEQQEGSAVQAPKNGKKAKKITELPIPSPPARLIKSTSTPAIGTRKSKAAVQQERGEEDDRPPKTSMNGKVGSKTSSKDLKRTANTRSKASETPKSKTSTKGASRLSVVKAAASKPKSLYKITPMDPVGLSDAINKASGDNGDIENPGSQWAVLPESNLTETPGQVDELLSDFTTPVRQSTKRAGASGEPLFLHSETQQSFPYSQYSVFSAKGGPSHESDDENEVVASVVKAKPQGTYRRLSQIASSQTFAAPKFQPADFGRTKEPESLYGRGRSEVVSETESSSESDVEDTPFASHIPASRRAGFLKK